MSKLSFTVSPARNARAPSSHAGVSGVLPLVLSRGRSQILPHHQSDRRKHRRAELLGHAPLLRRENRIVSHQASVSIRLQEMTVTFSATGSPSLPSSSMLLQRQWL